MLYAVIKVINAVFGLLELAIFIECISSWVPQLRYNSFIEGIHNITEPIMQPFRQLQDRLVPGLPIDFSPILVFLCIGFVQNTLDRILWMIL